MTTKELPRLTTALRAFAHLSLPYETPSPEEFRKLVEQKLRQRAVKKAAAESLQWHDLSSVVKSTSKNGGALSTLRELLKAAKKIGN